MKKGRMPELPDRRHVPEIRDVDLFGDGDLYTVSFFYEGGLVIGKKGKLELSPNVRIVSVRRQEREDSRDVYIRESVLKRIRARVTKKGVLE